MNLTNTIRVTLGAFISFIESESDTCCLYITSLFQRVVSVGLDQHATINVWDWRKGKILATVRGHSDRVSTYTLREGSFQSLGGVSENSELQFRVNSLLKS